MGCGEWEAEMGPVGRRGRGRRLAALGRREGRAWERETGVTAGTHAKLERRGKIGKKCQNLLVRRALREKSFSLIRKLMRTGGSTTVRPPSSGLF